MNKFLYFFFVFCFAFSNSIYAFGGSIWQNVAVVTCLLVVLFKGVDKVGYATVYFVVCCLLSILVNNIPDFFHPGERFIQYIVVLLSFSPLLQGNGIHAFRLKMMETVIIALTVITIASFLLRCAGGGITSVGYFGYAQHPNFLGFFSMITTIALLMLFFLATKKKVRLIIGGLFVFSLLTVMLSAARICLAGTVLGCLVFIYLYYKDNLSRLLTVVIVVAALVAVAFPLYEPYLDGVLYKQNAAEEAGSGTLSRDGIWATRMEEIRRYPILGVGCFSVDTSIEEDDTYYNPYNVLMGTVELGSTYLGVMSQTGILGMIGFVAILVMALWRCWKTMKETDSLIPLWLLSVFAALAVHMVVEGYATHAGSMQCIFLWLLLSCMMMPAETMEEEEVDIAMAIGAEVEEVEDDEQEE